MRMKSIRKKIYRGWNKKITLKIILNYKKIVIKKQGSNSTK